MSVTKVSPLPRRHVETPEDVDARRAADLARVGRFIGNLQAKGIYGKIVVSLHNGKITELRVEQVMKLDDLG